MQGWLINPLTGDYVLNGGAPTQTNSLQLPAYYRLKIKRKKWMYAPSDDYGSDYYTVVKRPASNSNSLLETIGANALQPIVDDGRASSIEVQVVENVRHGSGLQVTITDSSGQVEVQTFKGVGV